MNAALGSGSGADTLTGPATSSCAISQRMARVKSSWCTHDTYCRPSPDVPPRPRRTSASSVSNTPPRSALIVIAERRAILRVRGVDAASSARSQAVATSMLNRHVSGTSGSAPPIVPCSSCAGPNVWA